MDYAIKVSAKQRQPGLNAYEDQSFTYYLGNSRYGGFSFRGQKDIRRWKTEAGAQKFWNSNKETFERYYKIVSVEIVQLDELEPPPFKPSISLNKDQLKEIRKQIIEALFEKGWTANKEYIRRGRAIDPNYTGYLIDKDNRYAITMKPTVMTVHDGAREFCKVISMQYNQIEIREDELVCGKIALKM